MSTAALMKGSALAFTLLGLGLLFLPSEFAPLVGLPLGAEILLQLASAGFLTIAALDWTGRNAIYGGIYGRPIVVANFAFGMVGGGSLLSSQLRGAGTAAGWLLTGVMVLYAAGFTRLLFVSPNLTSSE